MPLLVNRGVSRDRNSITHEGVLELNIVVNNCEKHQNIQQEQ